MFPPGDDVLENDGVDDAVEEMLLDVVDGHPANDCVLVGGDTAIADEFHREDAPSPTVPDPATASLPGPSTSSAPPSTDASATPSPTLSTVRTPTLSESELTLRQFQRFLLTDEQVAEFEDFFSKGLTDPHPLFQSWLPLRKATIRTEEEAFDQVLLRTVRRGEPRKARKRRATGPEGPARNDPCSPEWEEIHQNAENRALQRADGGCGSRGGRGSRGGHGSKGGRGRGGRGT